jgi:hypothetical protein
LTDSSPLVLNRFFSLFFFILAGHVFAQTTLVYDNGAPNLRSGFEITHWIEADRFTLTDAALVENVKFWDLEIVGYFQSSIVWEIRSDSGNETPGSLLFSGTSTNLTHVATGRNDGFGFSEFVNTFNITPTALAAGTYWLILHNGPLSNNVTANVFWETANNPSTIQSQTIIAPFTEPWDSNGPLSKLTFQLNGVPGPRVTAFVFSSGASGINFTTVAGQNYRVEYKSNFTDPSWTTLTGAEMVSGTGGVVQVSDPTAVNLPRRFYRVLLINGSTASSNLPTALEGSPPAPLPVFEQHKIDMEPTPMER